ncbi:MAG: ComEC/Rec2 family competence protein [Candidatus Omnitrophota bacterium]
MKEAPLGGLAAAFATGIWIANYTDISFIALVICSSSVLAGALFLSSSRKLSVVCIFLAVFLLGAAVLRNAQRLPPSHISNFTQHRSENVSIRGVVDSDPVETKRSSSFMLMAESLIRDNKERKTCGRLLIKFFPKEKISYGDRICLEGNLYRVPRFRISENFNYRDYMENKGIYSILSVKKGSSVKILEEARGRLLRMSAYRLRRRTRRMIKENMSGSSASMISAMVLGAREDLPERLRQLMVRSGTVHIIAISGLHVGLVSLMALIVLRFFGIPKKASYIITFFALLFYCVLTGARTPVVRVTMMAAIVSYGILINRKANVFNSLAAAALLILLFRPSQLFDLSFQLSFVSVISIAGLSPKINNYILKSVRQKPGAMRLCALFSASIAAWIGILPFSMHYFKIISPIAILANIVVVPYMALVVGTAILAVAAGYIMPPAAPLFFAACELSVVFLIKMIEVFVSVPGSHFYI